MSHNSECIQDWIKSLNSRHTKYNYRTILERFLNWSQDIYGDVEATAITRSQLQAFVLHLESLGRAASYVQLHMIALRSWMAFTHQPYVYGLNIRKSSKALPPSGLDRTGRLRLMRQVERDGDRRDIAIITTLLFTGLRVSELCNLNVDDVQISDRTGLITVREGKGRKQRKIPLPLEAKRAIQEMRIESSGSLFRSYNTKGRLTPRAIQHLCSKYGTHPHELRHTYCRMLVASGADIGSVAVLAGHADIRTTMIYCQPSAEELANITTRAFSGV